MSEHQNARLRAVVANLSVEQFLVNRVWRGVLLTALQATQDVEVKDEGKYPSGE